MFKTRLDSDSQEGPRHFQSNFHKTSEISFGCDGLKVASTIAVAMAPGLSQILPLPQLCILERSIIGGLFIIGIPQDRAEAILW